MLIFAHASVLLALLGLAAADLSIFPPTSQPALPTDAPLHVMLFSTGAFINPNEYKPMFTKLQERAHLRGIRLWVGVPEPHLWTGGALSAQIYQADVINTVAAVRQAIAPHLSPNTPAVRWFHSGHSRGTIFAQDLVHDVLEAKAKKMTALRMQQQQSQSDASGDERMVAVNDSGKNELADVPCDGLILMTSSIQRKYRADNNGYFVPPPMRSTFPVMAIGAELDGMYKVFRQAEAVYHRNTRSFNGFNVPLDQMLIVRGASHTSFMNGSCINPIVCSNDLRAELPVQRVHDIVADIVVDAFLLAHTATGEVQQDATRRLLALQDETTRFAQPMIDSLLLESSPHLKPACYNLREGDARLNNCWAGSRWSEENQLSLAGLDGLNGVTRGRPQVSMSIRDMFWTVWYFSPLRQPEIDPSTLCVANNATSNACQLSVATITQCTYGLVDSFDMGITPTSCDELRTKMKSRQSIYIASGIANASFVELDDNNGMCQALNQRAIDWASKKLATTNRDSVPAGVKSPFDRYTQVGRRMVTDQDFEPSKAGPLWIWFPLQLKEETGSDGQKLLVVRSPNMRTPNDSAFPNSAGFHYCKLISPARVLEHMYTDSIKEAYKP